MQSRHTCSWTNRFIHTSHSYLSMTSKLYSSYQPANKPVIDQFLSKPANHSCPSRWAVNNCGLCGNLFFMLRRLWISVIIWMQLPYLFAVISHWELDNRRVGGQRQSKGLCSDTIEFKYSFPFITLLCWKLHKKIRSSIFLQFSAYKLYCFTFPI